MFKVYVQIRIVQSKYLSFSLNYYLILLKLTEVYFEEIFNFSIP